MNEQDFFNAQVDGYRANNSSDYYLFTKDVSTEVYKNYIHEGRLLEMGCAFGESTARLAPWVDQIISVEGVEAFIEDAKKTCSAQCNVEFVHSLFEDLTYSDEFDYVVANFIFEHVANVDEILQICHSALKKDSLLFTAVPNGEAFSRQLAVEMGLMDSIYDLTENDLSYGHRRVYDLPAYELDITRNGFEIVESGGLFVKPFADFQMRAMLESGIIGKPQLEGLIKMAKRYPRLAGSIYVVARKK